MQSDSIADIVPACGNARVEGSVQTDRSNFVEIASKRGTRCGSAKRRTRKVKAKRKFLLMPRPSKSLKVTVALLGSSLVRSTD